MSEPSSDTRNEPHGRSDTLWSGVGAALGLVLICGVGWYAWNRSQSADQECARPKADVQRAVAQTEVLPLAVATASPNPLKTAQRGNKKDASILELNGTRSHLGRGSAADGTQQSLTYQWSQVSGPDLKLRPPDLAKSRVGLRIFQPGTYRFSLVVSDGRNESAPAYVDTVVVDSHAAPGAGAGEARLPADATRGPLAVKLPETVEGVVGEQIRIEAAVSGTVNGPATYQWACQEPPALVIPEKLARNSTLVFVPKTPGSYVFKVTVADANTSRAEAQTTIVVKDAHNE
ncbi:MAG: hypothetical protein NTW87_26530 [Planctomycetota bacterium]|nr:hypothetical protein [Planctomycetota bacterium]